MPYTPTVWTDEVPGASPQTYDIEGVATDVTITPHDAPTPGTDYSAANMNHIEEGLESVTALLEALVTPQRQGGSATDWATAGTNNYQATSGKLQVGTGTVPAGGNLTVTFPHAYDYKPVVLVIPLGTTQPVVMTVYTVTATQFSAYAKLSTTGAAIGAQFMWIAIGPHAE